MQKPVATTIYWGTAIILALIAHFMYSAYGFNPTDEGFILAYSKRVWQGEIPHVDFISIRPALSAYLHVPEIAFGGNSTLWISRGVFWLQMALITGIWIKLILPSFSINAIPKYLLALAVGFMLSTHNYPPMAWHTIDGITLSSFAVFFLYKSPSPWRSVAFLLAGAAALCKQNFIVVGPILLFFYHRHFWRNCFLWLLPIGAYIAFIASQGGLTEMLWQFSSETSLWQTGIVAYIGNGAFWSGLLLVFITWLWQQHWPNHVQWVAAFRLAIVAILCSWVLASGIFFQWPSFFLFGMALSVLILEVSYQRFIASILLLLAWASSVSIGLNSPVLLIGPVAIFIFQSNFKVLPKTWWWTAALAIVIVGFHYGRSHFIYRDLAMHRLNHPLGKVLTIGKHIYTNQRVRDYFADLKQLSHQYKQVVPLPYSGAYWTANDSANPTPIHWTSGIELQNEQVRSRYIDDIKQLSEETVFLIPKYHVTTLGHTRAEMQDFGNKYPICEYIIQEYRQVSESSYFLVYKKP